MKWLTAALVFDALVLTLIVYATLAPVARALAGLP